jgi:FkbM family methyltransferase
MTEPTIRVAGGGWVPVSLKEYPLREALFADAPGGTLEVSFRGPELTVPVLQHAWSGVAEVQLDGGPVYRADLYAPFPLVTLWRFCGLADGDHTLTVRLAAVVNPAALGRQATVGKPSTAAEAAFHPARLLSRLTSLCDGVEGRFVVQNADAGVSRAILGTGGWAPDDVDLFRRLVRPGDVVLDVGANIGHHTVVYSKAAGPAGRVYAFEPQRWVFQVLCANLVANDCLNASAHRLALGDKPGRLRLQAVDYTADLNFGAAALSKLFQGDMRGESVPVGTLDAFVADEEVPRVDFVKLDVQTFELFVLQGAKETLRRFRPRLFVEIAPYWMKRLNGYDHREVYALLREAGYDLLDKRLEPVDEAAPIPDGPGPEAEWDVVAVPRESPLARAA